MVRAAIEENPGQDVTVMAGAVGRRSLLRSAPTVDAHHTRLENWIVRTIGDEDEAASTEWNDLIGRIAPARGQRGTRHTEKRRGDATAGWSHFQLFRRRGITIVALSDRALLKDHDLSELAGDLSALVAAGHNRILLNFSAVERLSSWVVAAVADVARRCTGVRGGTLRICGLHPELARVFALTGLSREIRLFSDENTAIENPWPEHPALRPLPVDVLKALSENVAVARNLEDTRAEFDDIFDAGESLDTATLAGIWLIVIEGKQAGQVFSLPAMGLTIGRDARCLIRPAAASVSRLHATVDRRGDQVVVRDLGSTNGTTHNGRVLRAESAVVAHGDTIQVGPLVLRVEVGPSHEVLDQVESLVADWVREDDAGTGDDPPTRCDLAIPAEDEIATDVRVRTIENVVVVTPQQDDLSDRATTESLRSALVALLQDTPPKRVVVDLVHTGQIQGRAVGILVAFHMRLESMGGTLRVCQANPRVAALLEQVQLTMLVDYYALLDDAVLAAWPDDISTS